MRNIVRILLYNHLFDLSRKKEKVFLTFSIRPVPKLEKSREKRLSLNSTKGDKKACPKIGLSSHFVFEYLYLFCAKVEFVNFVVDVKIVFFYKFDV